MLVAIHVIEDLLFLGTYIEPGLMTTLSIYLFMMVVIGLIVDVALRLE